MSALRPMVQSLSLRCGVLAMAEACPIARADGKLRGPEFRRLWLRKPGTRTRFVICQTVVIRLQTAANGAILRAVGVNRIQPCMLRIDSVDDSTTLK